MQTKQQIISFYDVLNYVRSTFDTEEVLDSLPLAAAGNPNAWHAWRTHRKKLGKISSEPFPSENAEDNATVSESTRITTEAKAAAAQQQQGRDPSEWNWEGVWELRVKKAIAASLSEPVLYGGAMSGVGDDVVSPRRLPIPMRQARRQFLS
jgi:hypothetical protein